MEVAVVINPVSGRGGADLGRSRAELAAAALDRAGVDGGVFVTERAGHAFDLARAAVGRGASRVIAWGGDGTLNEVGRALLFSPCALGVVPAGSGNGLARALGVPRTSAAALDHALAAPIARIDAGEIAGHVFLNIAGLGFDAHVAHAFSRRGGARGLQRYVRVVSRELFWYTPARYRVHIDGEMREHRAFLLSIANGPQWGNGARIAPGARLDDGLLDVVIAETATPLGLALRIPRLFTGTISRAPGVLTKRVASFTVTTDEPATLHVDGEPVVCGTGALHVRVLNGALRVCATDLRN
jgi:YegS/Rv2252/BmrU family lipid kinase